MVNYLDKTEVAHLRFLVEERMKILEREAVPHAELRSKDLEYSQLISIDQTLTSMLDEMGEDA